VQAEVVIRILRAAFATLDAVALAVALGHGTGSVGNFFSYFTVESNVLAIVVLGVEAAARPGGSGWAWLRGAATFAMVVTGVVYAVLLAGADVGVIDAWVNTVLHQVGPAVMLLDWVLLPPVVRRFSRTVWWLALPLAYLVYSLIRGPLVDFYPYPFLDPRLSGGYARIAAYAVGLAAVMAGLALAIGAVGARLARGTPEQTRRRLRS